MDAKDLLDSRKFCNRMDALVAIWGRKRPLPSDEDKAEALQPILDHLIETGLLQSKQSKPSDPTANMTASEAAAYEAEAKEAARNNYAGLNERAKEMLEIIDKAGKASATSPFKVVLSRDGSYPIPNLPEYLARFDMPYKQAEESYVDLNSRQWVVTLAKA